MLYNSTRNKNVSVSSAKAINEGISKDGGLFVPEFLPQIDKTFVDNIKSLDYIGRAKEVLKLFLTDFTEEEINECVVGAYNNTFDDNIPAPLSDMSDGRYILELWHGPTCAFKDMALQLLPHLLTKSASKAGDGKKTVILVATSGDTGKAALEGFKDVDNTEIIVFYPVDGVSNTQKLQMATQTGKNVYVCAINGNFDDAQSGVKKIFTDSAVADKLANNNMVFSSANSINWGRLLPQIVYYISAYCDLINANESLESFNVVVPTGNFGNILAAFYAKCMGIPINKLICASNSNNVLTDFITTGTYDRNRSFHTTISPSMDILISSNLERLLYHLSGNDDGRVSKWMKDLSDKGVYTVDDDVRVAVSDYFVAGYADDSKTKETINKLFSKTGYLCDTHTAVALSVYEEYAAKSGDKTPTVIVSTASPYKFATDVLDAVEQGSADNLDGIECMNKLSEVTSTDIPAPLENLAGREIRFKQTINPADMTEAVYNYLNIK